MKLRKITSLVITSAMVITAAAAIYMPTASAKTENGVFTEDFENMPLTSTTTASATTEALAEDDWWQVTSTTAGKFTGNFAEVVGDDSNHYLQLTTPGNSTKYYDYGIGRLFPGQGTTAKGVWDISFRFMPAGTKANPIQFNFSMNTLNGDTETAPHNIISAYNNKMYLGYRAYKPLYDGAGVPQGRIDNGAVAGSVALVWYDVKVKLDCDRRYYSVELWRNGELMARRSPVNFAGNETISFLKLSALGMTTIARVFVDDIRIAPGKKDNTIYHEDFEFESSALVSDGISTGGETEDVSGHSYFEGYTPWRAHKDIGKAYSLEVDPDIASQAVTLGDDSSATGSGLIYMPALDKIVTSSTQNIRGMVKTSFKFKPETIGEGGAKVNVIGDYTQDITDASSVAFEIADDNGTPVLVKNDGSYAELDSETWYDAEMVFDVTNGTVKTTVVDLSLEEEVASFTSTVDTIAEKNAIKGIMFNVPGGSVVRADDINLEYYMPVPVIGKVVAMDQFGEIIQDGASITAALKAIRIPVGCALNPNTANVNTITLEDENSNVIEYTASLAGNAYTLNLTNLLKPNTSYRVTVPATVANVAGDKLGEPYTFTFKTTNALSDRMRIDAVKVDGEEDKALSDISAGSEISVVTKYANSTAEAIKGSAIVVFYDQGGNAVKVLTNGTTVAAGAYGTDDTTFKFEVPSDIDMTQISKVSVLLWDGFTDITPYCSPVSFE